MEHSAPETQASEKHGHLGPWWRSCPSDGVLDDAGQGPDHETVPYTHLTLPPIDRVNRTAVRRILTNYTI